MNPYQTSDQGLAAYLFCNEMELLGTVQKEGEKRQYFVFNDQDNRDQLVEQFISGQGQVSAKKYAYSIKQVNKALKSPLSLSDATE